MPATPITCVSDCGDKLGEGCLWDGSTQALWWLDIARPSRIHQLVPANGAHRVWHSTVLLTAIARRSRDGFVLAGEDGIYTFDDATGAITPFAFPESGKPNNRFNDGACDAQGRFWVGTMQQNIGPAGEDLPLTADSGVLYCVGPHGKSRVQEQSIGVSNGPCWSPDGRTFYFSDSKNQVIWAYDFDAVEGMISNRRCLNDTRDYGYPDGATVDADGCLWSARWDGACILRIDPKGRIDRVIPMPATRPTCVCFGGPRLDTLYVTSSRAHASSDVLSRYPLQGGLFCLNPGVKGFEKHSFVG